MPIEVMPGYEMLDMSVLDPDGVDFFTLVAFTDLKESWYGAMVDKTKYRVVFEDETEDNVYLKLVKIQQEKE